MLVLLLDVGRVTGPLMAASYAAAAAAETSVSTPRSAADSGTVNVGVPPTMLVALDASVCLWLVAATAA